VVTVIAGPAAAEAAVAGALPARLDAVASAAVSVLPLHPTNKATAKPQDSLKYEGDRVMMAKNSMEIGVNQAFARRRHSVRLGRTRS
jgi:hypothetical protein